MGGVIPTSSATDITDEQRRELDLNGYTVLPDLLTEGECDALADEVDRIWSAGDYSAHGEPGVRFVPMVLRYSAIFEKCIDHPLVVASARHILGPGVRLNLINGRHAYPGTGHQPLHDFGRPPGPPFEKCNVIWCLDEFTATNGATRVVPGSHRDRDQVVARMMDPMHTHPDERLVVAPRGAAIMHNSHLIHSGTRNRTDVPRRSIHNAYSTLEIPSYYDWTTVPDHIKEKLSGQTLDLLGLR